MSHNQTCIAQPDLFVRGAGELMAEVRRHGGGTPPRFIAPDPCEACEDCLPYSPVKFAEELRASEQRADRAEARTVSIRVVDVGDFHRFAQ